MELKEVIRQNIVNNKIKVAQIDPNGLCNGKCWFCPVKYKGNPKPFINQMSIYNVEVILDKLKNSKLCSDNFNEILTTNYNEIFLYDKFQKLIPLLGKYDFKTIILTNGTTFTRQIIDTISQNLNVVHEIWLNIPTLNQEQWKIQTGLSDVLYTRLRNNLDLLHEELGNKVQIILRMLYFSDKQITNISDNHNCIITTESAIKENFLSVKSLYPKFYVASIGGLIDRCGILSEFSVFKNTSTGTIKENELISGCTFLYENVSRIYSWMCINSVGDVFLCCNDYDMKYSFGNLLTQSLEECWLSDRHVNVIMDALTNLCVNCSYRQVDSKLHNIRLI